MPETPTPETGKDEDLKSKGIRWLFSQEANTVFSAVILISGLYGLSYFFTTVVPEHTKQIAEATERMHETHLKSLERMAVTQAASLTEMRQALEKTQDRLDKANERLIDFLQKNRNNSIGAMPLGSPPDTLLEEAPPVPTSP